MNILLTNDDGYFAPGIKALVKVLSPMHNVYVSAPEYEMSGASHQVSFFYGVTYKKIENYMGGIPCFAVDGSPADSVLFATKQLIPDVKIDLVISGINSVMNVGSDIIYSGTFGAAQEATFLGLKGIAVSTDAPNEDYSYTATWVSENIDRLYAIASPDYTVNINFPHERKEDIKGVLTGPVSRRPYVDGFKVVGKVENGRELYRISGYPIPQKDDPLVKDVPQVENDYISISCIKLFESDMDGIDKAEKEGFTL